MTVISEEIANIAGADNNTQFVFSAPVVRDNADSTGLITTRTEHLRAIAGVLTTPDLDPGPVTLQVGQQTYYITVPDSPTAIRLMPLIEAAMPIPPAHELDAVRNAGGVARIKRLTQAEYNAIPTPDPATLYVVVP